jgi:serine-type D-Ala-D-Ala carboxypeptidase/endopeptidase (penicillin-binding protein 4)
MKRLHLSIFFQFILLLKPMLYAQSALENTIQALANDPIMQRGFLGVCVADAATGQMLASHHAQASLIPASNMKIVTTAAGLGILGKDYRFKTLLQYDGSIKDGVLTGNIFIKGFGDPTLGSATPFDTVRSFTGILDAFALEIKKLGIQKIVGKVIGDATAFKSNLAEPTWLYEDLAADYGAGASGLNLHDNLYYVRFYTATDKPSILSVTPEIPYLQISNESISEAASPEDANLYGMPYSNQIYVRGSFSNHSIDATLNGAIPDPAYFAAWQLHRRLKWLNVEITDSVANAVNVKLDTSVQRTTFYTHFSPTLGQIVRPTNLESINLYCEAITKAIAYEKTGIGTSRKGIELILEFWKNKGIDIGSLFMMDGSGLSPRNGISPLQLVTILRSIKQDSVIFPTFFESLPEPGKSGTMRNMMKKTEAIGRLRAKSGTLTRVKCYSGYVTTISGKELVFSAMTNNFSGSQRDIRKKLEELMLAICRH